MSLIHCRIRDGERRYRLWSTVVDAYLTDDMTYEETVTELRIEAIRRALREVEGPGLEQRFERAHETGTSEALRGAGVPLDGPWEAENEEDDEE